jgi:hypothetical protein
MLRRVALVRTDVSEEVSASFIRVTRIGKFGTTLTVTSNRRTLRGLRFIHPSATGPCQWCNSRIQVPQDLRPHLIIFLETRFPFLSSLTTRRATVEVSNLPPHGIILVISVVSDYISSARNADRTSLPTVLLLRHPAIARTEQRTPTGRVLLLCA